MDKVWTNKVWKAYMIHNKSVTEISKEFNITKNKLKTKYGIW
tara:strand:+ start:4246 stop:4371 length:126 start_codon:yes stop_codon:yes gene_type:complete